MMPSRFGLLLLVVIVLAGSALRLHRLGSMSYSNDELSAITRASPPHFEQFTEGIRTDGHPAGVQLWLRGYTKLLGTNELVVRLPFALCGIASILIVFLLGKIWFGEATGLLAAASVALLEFPIIYSQLARPYAPGLLWVLLAALFLTRLMRSTPWRAMDVALWILFSALALYTHYFSALAVVILGLIGIAIVPAVHRLKFLMAGGACALLFIPHAGITVDQMSLGGVGWLPVPSIGFVTDHVSFIFNDSDLLLFAILGLAALSVILLWREVRWTSWHSAALILFLAPILAGIIWSNEVKPVLQHSSLIFTMPFALLFLFSFAKSAIGHAAAVVGILAMTGSLLLGRNFLSRPDPDPFRQVAAAGARLLQQYGPGHVLSVADVNGPAYLNFYLNREGLNLEFPIFKCCDFQSKSFADSVLRYSTKDYLLFLSPRGEHDPRLLAMIQQRYPRPIEDTTIQKGMVSLSGKWDKPITPLPDDSSFSRSEFISILDTPFVAAHSGTPYLAVALIRSDHIPMNATLCCQVLSNGVSSYWDDALVADGDPVNDSLTKVFVSGTFPATGIKSGSQIQVFIWNRDRLSLDVVAFDFVTFK